jgi:nuclear RNA export factor
MMADLHVGPDDIVKKFKVLPKTHHDITGPAEKFSLDAFPVPHGTSTGLLIIVRGQFTEADIGGIRSFDRTFMVVPAPEGSRARLSGWSIMILSDQWTVRAYSSADAWTPGPLLLNHPPKDNFSIKSYPPDQQTALNSLPEAQRALVIQLSAQTKLTANFAVDCLQGNGWDLKQAVENFNQVKNSLGPEAFLVL